MSNLKILATLDGVRRVQRSLQLLDAETRTRAAGAVDASVDEAVHEAQSRVPRRTEELARTIRKSKSKDGLAAWLQVGFGSLRRRSRSKGLRKSRRRARQLGPVEPGIYAMVVEFGDAKRNKPAEPYIVPAIEVVRPHHQARIAAALKGAASAAERGGAVA
jgi:hypothetical protein